ncbi:MAG: methyltransferase domain-containing protein [Ruminococcus sp.]|nr:methyltransferase domain-containing protein [Ruminococcus sp.]
MSVIGDSSAVFELNRMLPQHQAAITLINTIIQNPNIKEFDWLDLACGKGQIISQLNENLTLAHRRKIVYHGYDINADYSKMVTRIAKDLQFKDYSVAIGDLAMFQNIVSDQNKFDFITCTNVTHEIHPQKFFEVIIGAIKRLSEKGHLFLYDMESLTNPELGALPLKASEVGFLIEVILKTAGSEFKASPSTWSHRTCKGWSIVINREFLGIDNEDLEKQGKEIIKNLHDTINSMLNKKLDECKQVLNSYTDYGTETGEDEAQKISALYEFWALHNALEDLA